MTNLLRANLFRLRKTLIFWGGLAASAGFGAFMVYTRVSDYQRYGTVFILDRIFFVFGIMTGFLLSMVVSTTLGTEYSDSTIRNKLTVGHLRRDVYLANLLSMILTGWLYCAAYALAVTVLGVPFAGWLTVPGKVIGVAFAGIFILEAAFCAIYTAISMNCSHKAATAIICMVAFFAMMVASTYVYSRLEAPPELSNYVITVDGISTENLGPNPRYLEGTARTFYEFLFDLLPTGQSTQYFMLEFAHPLRMILCALGITAVSTGAGLALFRRKDLK